MGGKNLCITSLISTAMIDISLTVTWSIHISVKMRENPLTKYIHFFNCGRK